MGGKEKKDNPNSSILTPPNCSAYRIEVNGEKINPKEEEDGIGLERSLEKEAKVAEKGDDTNVVPVARSASA